MRFSIGFFMVCALFSVSVVSAQRVLFPVDLRPGIKNEVEVIVLQKFLKAERLYDGPVLGIYDTTTAKAVQKFQEKYQIRPNDGVFRGTTRARANAIIDKQMEEYTISTGTNVDGPQQKKKPVTTPPPPSTEKKIFETSTQSFGSEPEKKTTPKGKQNCFVATNMIKHGETKTMYRYPVPAQNGNCLSDKRTCTNGFLDGDPGYRYTTCKGTAQTAAQVKNSQHNSATQSGTGEKRLTCLMAKDANNNDVQLCATLPENGVCSTQEYPCAFVGPDAQKACFAKVNGKCPRVPKTK